MQNLYNKIFGENSNGILEIDSKKKGKTFGIVACTHGNEKVGLHVMDYLLNNLDIKNNLKSGKIIFILGNIEAMKKNQRFVDFDFNRIWGFEEKYNGSIEYKRALEIKDIFKEIDILFDIHSTSLESDPFFVPVSNNLKTDFFEILDVDYSIEKIIGFLNGKALTKYFIEQNPKGVSFVLESGSHNAQKTINLSIKNTINILKYFDFIDGKIEKQKEFKKYKVEKVIKSKSLDVKFLYSENPKSFDFIKAGEKIVFNGKNEIISDRDYFILMPSFPKYIGDEIGYLLIS